MLKTKSTTKDLFKEVTHKLNIINGNHFIDPELCHETSLDIIRKKLKRVGNICDNMIKIPKQ